MEAAHSSEKSGTIFQTTRRHIPEDSDLRSHPHENLKSQIIYLDVYLKCFSLNHVTSGKHTKMHFKRIVPESFVDASVMLYRAWSTKQVI
jgi:hypothetical protein